MTIYPDSPVRAGGCARTGDLLYATRSCLWAGLSTATPTPPELRNAARLRCCYERRRRSHLHIVAPNRGGRTAVGFGGVGRSVAEEAHRADRRVWKGGPIRLAATGL